MNIYRAQSAHASLLSILGANTFEQTFKGTCSDEDLKSVLDTFFNLPQVEIELKDTKDYFFIYQVQDTALGYSRLKNNENEELEIFKEKKSIELKRIYFLREAHGKGYAQELILHNEAFAKKLGFERIYLSVWEHNHRAMKFYQKMGYKNSGMAYDFPLGNTPQTDFWFYKELV